MAISQEAAILHHHQGQYTHAVTMPWPCKFSLIYPIVKELVKVCRRGRCNPNKSFSEHCPGQGVLHKIVKVPGILLYPVRVLRDRFCIEEKSNRKKKN